MPFQRQFTIKRLLKAATFAATTGTGKVSTGGAVDISTYINAGGREMKAILEAAVTATSSLVVKLQESAGGTTTTWADITGAAFTALTTTGGTSEIHFKTNQRYVRALATRAICKGMTYTALLQVEKRVS